MGRYKFTSIWIEFEQNKVIIERSTYSFLDWLGDIGGLFDALKYLAGFTLLPIANFNLHSFIITSIFFTA